MNTPYQQGWNDFFAGIPVDENPFNGWFEMAVMWRDGWKTAQAYDDHEPVMPDTLGDIDDMQNFEDNYCPQCEVD